MSIVEILVAVSVFIIGVVTITLMYISSLSGSLASLERARALFLAQEGLEATKSVKNSDAGNLSAGDYKLSLSNNHWVLFNDDSLEPYILDGFTRTITVTPDSSDNWLILSQVEWSHPLTGVTESLELVESFNNL